MKKFLLPLLIAQAFTLNAFAEKQEQNNRVYNLSEVEDLAPAPTNNTTITSYQWVKEVHSSRKALIKTATTVSPLMVAHTNPATVMSTVVTTPIFWGSSWANTTLASDKVKGLTIWYTNLQSSQYISTVREYTALQHSSIPPLFVTTATSTSSSNPANVLTLVCNALSKANLTPTATGYYPVYTDLPRGTATYCAYHSAGTCGGSGTPVQFAFFFNLNNDTGCDPKSPYAPSISNAQGIYVPNTIAQNSGSIVTGGSNFPQQSQGLAALANVSAHELMETVTDRAYFTTTGGYWGGWYDSTGAENGDKCAWTFGPSNTKLSAGTVLIGGYDWKLQGEWSNNAQNGTGGYPTQGGLLKGCVTGS